jgi:exosortase/archaeosortase family protein
MIEEIRKRKKAFEESLEGRDQRLWEVFLFLVRFTVLAAPLYLLLWNDWNPIWLREMNAAVGSNVLSLLDLDVVHSGSFIGTGQFSVDVSTDSTGWKSFLALVGLMLATREEALTKKLYGILLALVIVFAGNITRLVSMVYAVVVWGVDYQLIHTFFWRWGLTALVLVSWIAWLRWDHSSMQKRITTFLGHG